MENHDVLCRIACYVGLGMLVVDETAVMVQMLFVEVQQNADMGTGTGLFQLMGRKLADEAGARRYFVQYVEQGNAHVAGRYAGSERSKQVTGKGGGGAFSFRARDADGLCRIGSEEQVGL